MKPEMAILLVDAPDSFTEEIAGAGIICLDTEAHRIDTFVSKVSDRQDIVHIFTNTLHALLKSLAAAKSLIKQDGAIWVSWYKKAAKLPTEITEDTIRNAALPMGLVDIKVCAVDEKWSGLKLVIRKENRV